MQQIRSQKISEDFQTHLDEVIASLVDDVRRLGYTKENDENATTIWLP